MWCNNSIFNSYIQRNILAVDGTFLKSLFTGILLLAAQKDANNQNVTLCIAAVDVENAVNWIWFMNHLYHDFPGIKIVFADKASGLEATWSTGIARWARCVKHMISM